MERGGGGSVIGVTSGGLIAVTDTTTGRALCVSVDAEMCHATALLRLFENPLFYLCCSVESQAHVLVHAFALTSFFVRPFPFIALRGPLRCNHLSLVLL